MRGKDIYPCQVQSGVPQGTVLGPLLFLEYINDLPSQVSSSVRLFADDCLLYRTIHGPHNTGQLQEDLANLQSWENMWGMRFNPDKCEVISVTLKKKPVLTNYVIHSEVLRRVNCAKYLGVTIDSRLSFNSHVDNICKKGNQLRAFVHRNTKGCPRPIQSQAYSTIVRPALEYASVVWDPHTAKNINKLQKVQRRAARGVMNDWTRPNASEPQHQRPTKGSPTIMQTQLGWDTLQERRAKAKVKTLYKIVNNLLDVPIPPEFSRHSRNTRGHDLRFIIPTPRVQCFKFSFFPSAMVLWNRLPPQCVCAPFVETLSNHLAMMRIYGSPLY